MFSSFKILCYCALSIALATVAFFSVSVGASSEKTASSTGTPNILSPTRSAPDLVGKPDDPIKTSIEVELKTEGGDTLVTGLTGGDFTVTIGTTAHIVSCVELADKYVLDVLPPNQAAAGLYDLKVTALGETDTETEAIHYAETTRSNVDVVQVIDRSGSMADGCYEPGVYYLRDAKNAAGIFVDQMQTGDMIGVVSFSNSARVDYGITAITGSAVKTEAQNAIDSLRAYGSTGIGAGLRDAQAELTNNGAAIHPWALILLSDGQENRSPYVSTVLPDIVSTKTKIFSVALGSYADQALLQDIASQTNGQYYLSPTEKELAGIYNSLAGQVAGRQTLFSEEGNVQQGSTDEKIVDVDPSVKEVIFSISWSGAGNDLDLTLKDPHGNIVDSNTTDPNVSFTSGTNSESYAISSPASGKWTMQIFAGTITSVTSNIPLSVLRDKTTWISSNGDTAPDIKLWSSTYSKTSDAGLEYSAAVTADTPLTVNTYLDKSSHIQGDPILIKVTIADLQTIKGATAKARVTTPSSTGSFLLYDDGMHGDAAANDGIYGNAFTRTTEVGTYSFDMETAGASTAGDDFSRVSYASTYVSGANDSDGDGMPDGWESNFGLDPTLDDSANDPDADGLTNIQEYQNGTNPFNDHTDSDNLADGEEVNTHSTDPTKQDTDCGGENDGSEVANGRNPLDPDDDVSPSAGDEGGGGAGCFIATATFSSHVEPHACQNVE